MTKTLALTAAMIALAIALLTIGGWLCPPNEQVSCARLTPTSDTSPHLDYENGAWIDTRFDATFGYSLAEDSPIFADRQALTLCDSSHE